MSSRGSLPGFESSSIISDNVISPIFNCFDISSIFIDFNFVLSSSNFSLSFKSFLSNAIVSSNFSVAS